MKYIYLDHSATTPLCAEAVAAMQQCLESDFGNPSSLHSYGRAANRLMEQARTDTARLINAQPDTITFTGGGTEADNLAICGVICDHPGAHIITTEIEHPAVYNCCQALAAQGHPITYLPVNRQGLVEPDSLQQALRPNTVLVSIMHANNEIGSIQPIRELAELCHRQGALFHTDAVQSVGKIAVDVQELGVDLLSLSAHKINGPKGVGALYCRPGLQLRPLIHGGGQEQGLRSGTENMPGIVGLGAAARYTAAGWQVRAEQSRRDRDYLLSGLKRCLPDLVINGGMQSRLPGNLNISLPGLDSEAMLICLDRCGIALSAGSACSASSGHYSRVLQALHLPESCLNSALRLSLGAEYSREQLDYVIDSFCLTSRYLRRQR